MAQYLLEAGAVCNEYTFDGDRCHYASLTGVLPSENLLACELLLPAIMHQRTLCCNCMHAPGHHRAYPGRVLPCGNELSVAAMVQGQKYEHVGL